MLADFYSNSIQLKLIYLKKYLPLQYQLSARDSRGLLVQQLYVFQLLCN